ncbi:hypothetical protein GCK32_009490 [Trichostrongylus colubriformis]|uniref:Uncharacterized protein n=1 Tax=Trichostrongylus colubriformis TaxID=6319 RepID=A0AAN8G7P2_TRICO
MQFFFAVLALILSVAAFPSKVEVMDESSSESHEEADVREGPSDTDTFTSTTLWKGPQRHHPHYPGYGNYPYYGYGYYPYGYGHYY